MYLFKYEKCYNVDKQKNLCYAGSVGRKTEVDRRLVENLKNIDIDYVTPFIWLHNEEHEKIIAEIDRIQSCNIRSICLESRTHDEFCREDWWEDVAMIFKECKKRNMKVWILDDKHYPTGYANGIFDEKYRDLRSWGITEYHIDVAGPVKGGSAMVDIWLNCDLEYATTKRPEDIGEDEVVAVFAIKHIPNSDKYSDIIDITDGLSDGRVYFDLPEGRWRIVMAVKTRSGIAEWLLPSCDMLNPHAVDLFIEEVYQGHYDRFSEYFGNTFCGFFSDEPCFQNNTRDGFAPDMGVPYVHYPWHDKLKEMIDVKSLAGLWFDIENVSDQIRYSYMDLISKEYQKNFGDKVGDWCRAHNVMYIGHIIEDNNVHAKTGNGTGHFFRGLNGQDMSGVDVVLHQIVPGLTLCDNAGFVGYKHMNSKFFNYYLAKLGASLGHIDEKKKGRTMCEIFGAYGWAEGTKIMKYLMDHMLLRGVNYYVPHAFSPKEDDGETPPNFSDTGKNPLFKFFKNNMEYLNRMCYMLSDGIHIPSCAILYDGENYWINKEFLPVEAVAKELYDNLFDYDIIPADYLDKIKNGELNGEKYNVLIVPYAEVIPEAVAKKLKNADIKIITVSEKEWNSPFEFENITLDKLAEYMRKCNYADVTSDYEGIYLKYYHYKRDGAHIYMFVNEDINNTITASVNLSAFEGGQYIEYDGFENKAVLKTTDNSDISISIEPYHSLMIIFGDVETEGIEEYSPKTYSGERMVDAEFDISLMERCETEFKAYKTVKELPDITGRGERPDFSGHMKYETEIELDKKDFLLDLGCVGEAAEVYINDKFIGSKQIPPYRFEISKEDIKDKNKLTVIVSNHNAYALKDTFSKYLLIEPSGLLGPVKIFEKEE
ncbi:MAG: hypothetical protein E7415_05310 [Ruminococcaceae bacterium]|nr:hypothetical protein [Oscillospiraceae bacterium]